VSQTTLTVDEVIDSLTGHDEINIHACFSMTVTDMAQNHPTLLMRALVAVVDHRESGDSYRKAYVRAMDMPMGAVSKYFSDAPEDVDQEQPDSESGKDD
jgi:hypothetical protein